MSFDLLFCRRADQPQLTAEEVEQAMAKLPHVEALPDEHSRGPGYMYANPDTGVYCFFTLRAEPEEDEPVAEGESCDVRSTPLRFSLNYVRPSFFAAEAMPLAVQLAEELELLICDLSGDPPELGGEACRYSADELIKRWEPGNVFGVRYGCRDIPDFPTHCPRERLEYYWQYGSHSQALKQLYDEPYIIVPAMAVHRPREGGDGVLLFAWADVYPSVLPEADYVMIRRARPRLGGLLKREEVGVMSLEELRRIVGTYLKARAQPVPHLLYEEREPPRELTEALLEAPLMEQEAYEGVPIDEVVDVRPE